MRTLTRPGAAEPATVAVERQAERRRSRSTAAGWILTGT